MELQTYYLSRHLWNSHLELQSLHLELAREHGMKEFALDAQNMLKVIGPGLRELTAEIWDHTGALINWPKQVIH